MWRGLYWDSVRGRREGEEKQQNSGCLKHPQQFYSYFYHPDQQAGLHPARSKQAREHLLGVIILRPPLYPSMAGSITLYRLPRRSPSQLRVPEHKIPRNQRTSVWFSKSIAAESAPRVTFRLLMLVLIGMNLKD